MGEGATGEMAGLIGVDWRSANGLQSPHRAPISYPLMRELRMRHGDSGERIRQQGTRYGAGIQAPPRHEFDSLKLTACSPQQAGSQGECELRNGS